MAVNTRFHEKISGRNFCGRPAGSGADALYRQFKWLNEQSVHNWAYLEQRC